MRKRGKRLMIAVGAVFMLIGALIVFFQIPFSPLEHAFSADRDDMMRAAQTGQSAVFTEEDLAKLPEPVQQHFRACGLIGKPKMSMMKAEFNNVPFKQGKEGKPLIIDYTQYNSVAQPQRIALIESSLYGIPFDGYDRYRSGTGRMKGVVGKLVTLFDLTGTEMDRAAMVTFLAESLLLPNAALQEYITWEAVDDMHAKATITYRGLSAEGVFTFDEEGRMCSFTTEDRASYQNDGSFEYVRWSAICENYQDQGGYLVPTTLKAVWHYTDGDLVYFDGRNAVVTYS